MQYDFSRLKKGLEEAIEWLSREYMNMHTGRATPAVLDSVRVESYGSLQSIQHVAAISIEDARTLRVAPWDKTVIKSIEKAIQAANMGLSVSVDDQGVRVFFPELTSERKKILSKLFKDKLEDARITVRKVREDAWGEIVAKERDGELSEDDKFKLKDELQKHVDQTNDKLEALWKKKETEVT